MDNYKFYKYINEKSMLVITPKNELKRMYCPFAVRCKNNKLYNVTSIASGNDFKTYYCINGKHYIYSNYRIMS
jgi:hypothetical protein